MKLYGFANFVEQHLEPYRYASLVVIEALCGYYNRGFYCMMVINKLCYTVLMPEWLGGASLQLLAAYLPSTLFSVPIPAKYKVTESTV